MNAFELSELIDSLGLTWRKFADRLYIDRAALKLWLKDGVPPGMDKFIIWRVNDVFTQSSD